jgi:hypothetical protein
MDVNRLSQGEKVAGISAILLLLDMFIFKWFGLKADVSFAGISAEGSRNAWGSFGFIDIILLITILAALGLVYLSASDTRVDLPVAASVVVAVLGGLSVLLILFRLISPPDFGAGDLPDGIDQTRKIGAFLGLILAGALTYGGWRAMQEEGTSFQDAADNLGGGRGPGTGSGDTARDPYAAPPPPEDEPPSAPPPPPPPPPSGGAPPSA